MRIRISVPQSEAWRVGSSLCAIVGVFLLGLALSIDFPKAMGGFQGDASTYYSLTYSIVLDGDFTFERHDLTRVWKEFPAGPEGIFLKRGKTGGFARSSAFPFVRWVTQDDPEGRLYYGKAYLYSVAAAPFVWVFGTNGFLVFHALLMTLNLLVAYVFLVARTEPKAAASYALVFLFASVVPVYLVWLTSDLLNFSLVLYGLFLWCYKEVAPAVPEGRPLGRWLRSPWATYVAVILMGAATFSKPTNIALILPVLALAAWRRQWRHGLLVGVLFGAVVSGLFGVNAAITGEFNYQGGTRKTFYGSTGFPFLNRNATFETTGLDRATDRVPIETLFNRRSAWTVLRHNVVYFVFGRHTGLVPYFFPGVLSGLLFLAARGRRERWQWLVGGTAVISVAALLVYMPFTYSGGGAPVGNRYFLSFYPLFLFLTPPLRSVATAFAGAAVGGLFTAQLVLNPFYTSFRPAEHTKRGPYRALPVELSLVDDLPMNVSPSRVRQPLGGDPPLLAYFLDDNVYTGEPGAFWVRGERRTEVVVRAPARLRADGGWDSLKIRHLIVEVLNGDALNRVTVDTGRERQTVNLEPRAERAVTVELDAGLPYARSPGQPVNYVYLLSIASEAGFIPLFSHSRNSSNRHLGVRIGLTPVYDR